MFSHKTGEVGEGFITQGGCSKKGISVTFPKNNTF